MLVGKYSALSAAEGQDSTGTPALSGLQSPGLIYLLSALIQVQQVS